MNLNDEGLRLRAEDMVKVRVISRLQEERVPQADLDEYVKQWERLESDLNVHIDGFGKDPRDKASRLAFQYALMIYAQRESRRYIKWSEYLIRRLTRRDANAPSGVSIVTGFLQLGEALLQLERCAVTDGTLRDSTPQLVTSINRRLRRLHLVTFHMWKPIVAQLLATHRDASTVDKGIQSIERCAFLFAIEGSHPNYTRDFFHSLWPIVRATNRTATQLASDIEEELLKRLPSITRIRGERVFTDVSPVETLMGLSARRQKSLTIMALCLYDDLASGPDGARWLELDDPPKATIEHILPVRWSGNYTVRRGDHDWKKYWSEEHAASHLDAIENLIPLESAINLKAGVLPFREKYDTYIRVGGSRAARVPTAYASTVRELLEFANNNGQHFDVASMCSRQARMKSRFKEFFGAAFLRALLEATS